MKKTHNDRLAPVHPGEVLLEDFLKPLGLSAYAVAKAVGATPITISLIVRGKRAVTAEMALKLGRYFRVSPEIWLGLQRQFDLETARHEIGEQILREVPECRALCK